MEPITSNYYAGITQSKLREALNGLKTAVDAIAAIAEYQELAKEKKLFKDSVNKICTNCQRDESEVIVRCKWCGQIK